MKNFLIIVVTSLLFGCAHEPKGEWVNILAKEEWYQKNSVSEKSYIGIVYDKGEKKWLEMKEEYNRYFLELWYRRYDIHSPVDNKINLQEFVGKKVELIGKEKEIIYGRQKAKKILPGKIRLVE